MGNVVCCANNPDELVNKVNLGEIRKPKLFGAQTAGDSSSEGSDHEGQSIEGKSGFTAAACSKTNYVAPVESLRQLVPKIRSIKQQLDACSKQQIKLKEEVLSFKSGDTVSNPSLCQSSAVCSHRVFCSVIG